MKIYVVMYGDHGGELDRVETTLENAKVDLIKMIETTIIEVGDNFIIEQRNEVSPAKDKL